MQLPMGYFFLFMVTMPAVLAVAHSHGTVTSEVYWQLMLPNTPMPAVIRDHLSSGVVTHKSSKDLAGTAGGVRRPTTFVSPYGNNEDLVKTSRSNVDAKLIGPEENPVTIRKDVKRPFIPVFLYNIYEKKKDLIMTSRSNADATVIGPEENPVTIHKDVKRPFIPVFLYNIYEKKKDLVKTSRSNADATIIGLEENPVTIHKDVKRPFIPVFLYNIYEKKKDLVKTSRSNAHATVISPEPFLLFPFYNIYEKTSDIHPKPNPITTANIGVTSKQHASDDNRRINNPDALFYFLERDMHLGAKIEAGMFKRPLDGDHFLSPEVANSMPFSSGSLPDILSRFSIQPNSFVARKMEWVHYFCELPPIEGEKKHCATSLESMVDFITSSLDSSASNMVINALSSTSEKDNTTSTQIYTMASIRSVPMQGPTSVACHLEVYPYTVYHCHVTHGSKLYVIKLADQSAADTVEAVATCHRHTLDWDPDHYALRALKVKPGEASVCHFLPTGDITFFPTAATTTTNIATE